MTGLGLGLLTSAMTVSVTSIFLSLVYLGEKVVVKTAGGTTCPGTPD